METSLHRSEETNKGNQGVTNPTTTLAAAVPLASRMAPSLRRSLRVSHCHRVGGNEAGEGEERQRKKLHLKSETSSRVNARKSGAKILSSRPADRDHRTARKMTVDELQNS
jgi:hypothetical protein